MTSLWVQFKLFSNLSTGTVLRGQVTPAACGTPAVGVSFEICSTGDINIFDAYDSNGSTGYTGTPTVAENVPAIVISHGTDGFDISQTDVQVENYDRDPVNPNTGADILTTYTTTDYLNSTFVKKDYDSEGTDAYDDMVIWISPNVLINRMITAGKLP